MATTHSPWLPTNQQLRQAEGLWRQRTTRDKVVGRQSAWGSIKVFLLLLTAGQIVLWLLAAVLSLLIIFFGSGKSGKDDDDDGVHHHHHHQTKSDPNGNDFSSLALLV